MLWQCRASALCCGHGNTSVDNSHTSVAEGGGGRGWGEKRERGGGGRGWGGKREGEGRGREGVGWKEARRRGREGVGWEEGRGQGGERRVHKRVEAERCGGAQLLNAYTHTVDAVCTTHHLYSTGVLFLLHIHVGQVDPHCWDIRCGLTGLWEGRGGARGGAGGGAGGGTGGHEAW